MSESEANAGLKQFVPAEPQSGMQNQFEVDTDRTGMYVVDEAGNILETKSDILALQALGQAIFGLMHMPPIQELAVMDKLLTYAKGPQNEALPVETSAMQVGDKYAVRITSLEKTLERDTKLKASFEENERLKLLSTLDALTGINNRGEFGKALHREINRAIRGKLPVGLIMYDGDGLKAINDSLGHAAGDEAIKVLAGMKVRDTDSIFRYGGEEFTMIVAGDKETTRAAAERNRVRIAQNEKVPGFTASFGYANLPVGIDMTTLKRDLYLETDEQGLEYIMEALFEFADIATYASKFRGKNQVNDYENLLREILTEEEYSSLGQEPTARLIKMREYASKVKETFKYSGDRAPLFTKT